MHTRSAEEKRQDAGPAVAPLTTDPRGEAEEPPCLGCPYEPEPLIALTAERLLPALLQAPAISMAAKFFLPLRSTSQRPCSSSLAVATASSAVTFTLLT